MSELSPQARALLRSARSFDEPSAADRERVRLKVLTQVGAGIGVGAAVGSMSKSAAASASVSSPLMAGAIGKMGAALLILGGLSTAAYLATREEIPTVTVADAGLVEALDEERVGEAQEPESVEEGPEHIAPEAPEHTARGEEPVVVLSVDQPAPARPSPKVAQGNPDLQDELRLIREADAALRKGDAGTALARLSAHREKYPRGALRQEREGLRAMSLCRAGNVEQGRAAAERFLAQSPKSPLASRLKTACGE